MELATATFPVLGGHMWPVATALSLERENISIIAESSVVQYCVEHSVNTLETRIQELWGQGQKQTWVHYNATEEYLGWKEKVEDQFLAPKIQAFLVLDLDGLDIHVYIQPLKMALNQGSGQLFRSAAALKKLEDSYFKSHEQICKGFF